ncbi:hypothetical protein ACVIW0_006950 [Bradyrhizobium sp. USDA 4454]
MVDWDNRDNQMTDERKEGNEPSPIILIVVAIVPLLAIGAWLWSQYG